MTLSSDSFGFIQRIDAGSPAATILKSRAELASDGGITLRLNRDEAGCHSGDIGSYHLKPSATGLTLQSEAVADACPARLAAIGTTGWSRMSCPHAPQWCLGEMDAAQHVSINYLPFVRQPDWQFDYGRFGFTVPAGWVTSEDNADGYVLQPKGAGEGVGVYVFSDVLAHAQSIVCPSRPEGGVGSSAAAITRWIQSLPGLNVTNVTSNITVGGLKGSSMDLALKPTWNRSCSWANGEPLTELFVNAQTARGGGFEWGINGAGRERLFVLEMGGGRTLLVDIEAPDAATWKSLLVEAVPIVESFEFKH